MMRVVASNSSLLKAYGSQSNNGDGWAYTAKCREVEPPPRAIDERKTIVVVQNHTLVEISSIDESSGQ